jgi:hypothetical protein
MKLSINVVIGLMIAAIVMVLLMAMGTEYLGMGESTLKGWLP